MTDGKRIQMCLWTSVSSIPPGKTSAAVVLAKHYSAACLSIDSVVLEAISDGSSSAGLRARELCIRAAIEQAQRENEDGGKQDNEFWGVQHYNMFPNKPCFPPL